MSIAVAEGVFVGMSVHAIQRSCNCPLNGPLRGPWASLGGSARCCMAPLALYGLVVRPNHDPGLATATRGSSAGLLN